MDEEEDEEPFDLFVQVKYTGSNEYRKVDYQLGQKKLDEDNNDLKVVECKEWKDPNGKVHIGEENCKKA